MWIIEDNPAILEALRACSHKRTNKKAGAVITAQRLWVSPLSWIIEDNPAMLEAKQACLRSGQTKEQVLMITAQTLWARLTILDAAIVLASAPHECRIKSLVEENT